MEFGPVTTISYGIMENIPQETCANKGKKQKVVFSCGSERDTIDY